jgi:pimeloyl-ACP methyl ester carboxylesterase
MKNRNKILFKGETLSYTDEGKGPVVVLLHGYLMNADAWMDFRKNLSSSYRVICPDLPGHGKSSCWGYIHTMDFMAEAVKGLLDDLRIRKCTMVGHSMGGYVTLAFAEKYIENLRGFGWLFSTPFADSEERKRDRIRAMSFLKKKKSFYIRETLKGLFQSQELKYIRGVYQEVLRDALQISPRGAIAALRGMMFRPDREVVIRFSPVPVFCMNGVNDSVIPHHLMRELMDKYPHVVFVLEENLGHMGFLEYPAFCLHQFRKFLSRIHNNDK